MRIEPIHIAIFLICALFLVGGYIHEVTHQTIFSIFGVDSSIRVGDPLNGSLAQTVPEPMKVSKETRNAINISNSVNEVVGYNIMPYLVILTALSFAQFVVLTKISLQLEVRE